MSVQIGAAPSGRYRGMDPQAKTSMTIMRPPQHGHGRGRTREPSGPVFSGGCVSLATGKTASNARALAMFSARSPIGSVAYQNKAAVYAILFEAAAGTLRTIAADKKHLGASIGMTTAPWRRLCPLGPARSGPGSCARSCHSPDPTRGARRPALISASATRFSPARAGATGAPGPCKAARRPDRT